jgi:hypothetical protein
MRGIPHIGQQISEIYKILRMMPTAIIGDFLRTRFTSYHDTLQIAGSSLSTFAITSANTDENLTDQSRRCSEPPTAVGLPSSNTLAMLGGVVTTPNPVSDWYAESCHSRTYQKLVGLNQVAV